VIINSHDEVMREDARYLGLATNNVAEYSGLILALEHLVEMEAEEITIFSDSQLLANQLNRLYRVSDEKLKELFHKAIELMKQFQQVSVYHIPREQNMRADRLANLAIDRMSKPIG